MYDILFIVLLLIALATGYHNGFLKAVIGFAGVIASAIGGFLLYPYLTDILIKTPIYPWICSCLENLITPNLKESGLPELLINYSANTVTEAVKNMSDGIAVIILNIISVVIILIMIKFAVFFLKKTAGWINKLPVLGILNRISGMIVSGASAIIIIYIITAVIVMPPSNETEFSKEICRGINGSYVISKVMDYNFFVSYKSLSNVD